jgi:hypothetical protein
LKIGAVAVVVLGVAMFFWFKANKARAESELWVDVDAGTLPTLAKLIGDEYKDTNQGKVARFEVAFEFLWNRGIRLIGVSPTAAEGNIGEGIRRYNELATECKDDALLAPEALYSVAVGMEAMAAFDEKWLDEAAQKYQELAKGDYSNSAFGQLAKQRAKQLENREERTRIVTFYREFSTRAKSKEDFHPKLK